MSSYYCQYHIQIAFSIREFFHLNLFFHKFGTKTTLKLMEFIPLNLSSITFSSIRSILKDRQGIFQIKFRNVTTTAKKKRKIKISSICMLIQSEPLLAWLNDEQYKIYCENPNSLFFSMEFHHLINDWL